MARSSESRCYSFVCEPEGCPNGGKKSTFSNAVKCDGYFPKQKQNKKIVKKIDIYDLDFPFVSLSLDRKMYGYFLATKGGGKQ